MLRRVRAPDRKPLALSDLGNMVPAIQDGSRRSEQSKHDLRLPGVPLIAQGMTCPSK